MTALPTNTGPGALQGPLAKLLSGTQKTLGATDDFFAKPGGSLLMNLLAQQGFSTTPQSPLGAIGRASLATQKQQQERGANDLQRRLVESRIERNNRPGEGPDSPSDVRRFEFFESLGDGSDKLTSAQKRFLEVQRAQRDTSVPGAGFGRNVGGVFEPAVGEENIVSGIESRSAADERGTQNEQIAAIPARDEATSALTLPQELAGLDVQLSEIDRTLNTLEGVEENVSDTTTGFIGARLGNIEGTDAFDLRANIRTLSAALAFGQLQKMRAASKTGGALGQVSERELALLEAAVQSLDPNQSAEQMRENIKRVFTHYNNFKREISIMKNKMRERAGESSVPIENVDEPEVIDFNDLPE